MGMTNLRALLAGLSLSFLLTVAAVAAQPRPVLPSSVSGASAVPQPTATVLPAPAQPPQSLPQLAGQLPPPFGANLFAGAFQAERGDGLTPDYVLAPGDRVAVRLWGAVTVDEVSVVDAQGNLFIPNVGPVKVAGTRAGNLDAVVRSKVGSVYTQNVEVYVNVLTATPVSVYVTGPVLRPGQYSGLPTDSILSFVHRAGGIDPERGSYRKIRVLRANREIARVDLYRFLREGQVPNLRLADGDVILVEPQGLTVVVDGSARNPFRFEFAGQEALGAEIVDVTRPLASASHVAVSGNRVSGPFSAYVPIADFRSQRLRDGDRVRFEADELAQVIDISVEGSYLGPSFYAVRRDATLRELLDHIAVDPVSADTAAVYIRRKSVVRQQKDVLDEALRRLEQVVYTAPASSDGEANIRIKEAELVSQFVQRARQVQPQGKVVVSEGGRLADVRLEDGDVIVIPQKSDLVVIGGEVLIPQAVVYSSSLGVKDYIARAGGFTDRGDPGRIVVMHPNGAVALEASGEVKPGDQVLVMPKVETKNMQFVKDVTQILYQIAVAAGVALDL